VFGRGLSRVALAQLRETIRDEIKTELNRILSPNFIEIVTRGQADMEKIFDAVLVFQNELDAVKLTLDILQRRLEQSGG
jgi:hypothetical protein